MFDFSNNSADSKNYDNSNKLFFDKIKNETVGLATKEFVGLKLKMQPFLVDERSEHKKAKDVNENAVATISHSEMFC